MLEIRRSTVHFAVLQWRLWFDWAILRKLWQLWLLFDLGGMVSRPFAAEIYLKYDESVDRYFQTYQSENGDWKKDKKHRRDKSSAMSRFLCFCPDWWISLAHSYPVLIKELDTPKSCGLFCFFLQNYHFRSTPRFQIQELCVSAAFWVVWVPLQVLPQPERAQW